MKRYLILLTFIGLLKAAERPNVLLILSDDQAWGDYSFMGHEKIETPALDKLAAQSITYKRGYVSSPLCRPSLASIFLGIPTHEHGVTGNDLAVARKVRNNGRGTSEFGPMHETLYTNFGRHEGIAPLLQKEGYLTLQTGKWWESDPKKFGFTHAMTHGDPKRGGRHGDEGLKIAREGIAPIKDFLDIAEKEKKPFFIWHAPFLPHTPHNPPKELFEKYSKLTDSPAVAKYWAMCEWFDQTCGEVLAELDKRGLRENTIVIYVCDNGWIQDPADNAKYLERSKRSSYEGGIRTPILLNWPAEVKPVMDDETLVASTDIAPTILASCGVPVPAYMKGIDLRNREALKNRNTVYGINCEHDIASADDTLASLKSRYIIHGNWKLILPVKGDPELFHLKKDPNEHEDLAESNRKKVSELSALMDAWWKP